MSRLSGITMITILTGLSLAAWGQKTLTPQCQTPKLKDYTVFTIENIFGQKSDYQGLIGAGGSINLMNFFVGKKESHCLSITAGGDVNLKNILVASNIESQSSVSIHSADIRGYIKSLTQVRVEDAQVNDLVQAPSRIQIISASVKNKLQSRPQLRVRLDSVAQELHNLSNSYSAKSHDPSLRPLKYDRNEDFIEVELKKGLNIVNINQDTFDQHKQLFIHGNANDQLIIQIQGEDITLTDLTVHLTGGIEPQQIIWNMAQAKYLFIRNTGHPAHGLPGRILAPFARVQFYEGLVAGSIWAYAIDYNHHLGSIPSGQVNGDGFNGQQPFE